MAVEKTLTISSGSQNSEAWGGVDSLSGVGSHALLIAAPDALTGTITVELDMNKDSSNRDWKTLQQKDKQGNDVNIGAGKVVTISTLPLPPIRLHSDMSEGSDRTFKLYSSTS